MIPDFCYLYLFCIHQRPQSSPTPFPNWHLTDGLPQDSLLVWRNIKLTPLSIYWDPYTVLSIFICRVCHLKWYTFKFLFPLVQVEAPSHKDRFPFRSSFPHLYSKSRRLVVLMVTPISPHPFFTPHLSNTVQTIRNHSSRKIKFTPSSGNSHSSHWWASGNVKISEWDREYTSSL